MEEILVKLITSPPWAVSAARSALFAATLTIHDRLGKHSLKVHPIKRKVHTNKQSSNLRIRV